MDYPSFSVYPNPVQKNLQVNFKLIEDGLVQLFVTDLSGRKFAVYKNDHQANSSYSTQIDLSELASGPYFITIITSNYKETVKIIK